MILSMAQENNQIPRIPSSIYIGNDTKDENHKWEMIEGDDDDTYSSNLSSSSTNGSSSSSSDMTDDASSSSTSYSSSSSQSTGPDLYDLSDLMAQLPIKRGLSRFYQGKSQSFTSLSRVTSLEDLAKKESPYKKKMKASKSHGGGLSTYKSFTLPKPTISKKASKGSFSSSSSPTKRVSFLSNFKPPLVPTQKN